MDVKLRFKMAVLASVLLGISISALSLSTSEAGAANYLIGVGSYDITGPAADVNMMGYANPTQNTAGIHFRLRSRAFIVAEPPSNSSEGSRIVFVNVDSCMGSQAVTLSVFERLKSRYGDLYTEKNVAISGIHTHSGPGGYLQYILYVITSLGFVRQSFDALVDGIESSIVSAHENLRPGSLFINEGQLLEANINRSPSAYLNNPAEERAKYAYDVDKEMTLVKFVDEEWGEVGAVTWFPVHCTSMNRTNQLISGDNKGAASRFMEDWFRRKTSRHPFVEEATCGDRPYFGSEGLLSRRISKAVPHFYSRLARPVQDRNAHELAASMPSAGGKPSTRLSSVQHRVRSSYKESLRPPFVAAFAQSNVGDTSPNVLGAFCDDTGLRCDFNTSTCNGQNELCNGRGPGYPGDHFLSTKIIGERQYEKAVELFEGAQEQVVGSVAYRQAFVDFSQVEVTLPSGDVVTTCPAAVGFSFAAGTTDGPGAFDFKQGDAKGNAFWKLIGGAIKVPSDDQVKCQQPKPILIDTGECTKPYLWAPAILPIQILRVGQLIILSVPAEFTTMAGRRLRDAVKNTLIQNSVTQDFSKSHIVIAGLTNDYSQYVTTFEEYQIQRYEGASTLYGPHTLSAYIQEFQKLSAALAKGSKVAPGPSPPDLLSKQISLLPGVVTDGTPIGVNFGDVKQDVVNGATYSSGDTVEVVFYTGCPRNDLYTEGTYALVQSYNLATGLWVDQYDDDDWCLKFLWSRPSDLSSQSYATIQWQIPETAAAGIYRIRHFGAYKYIWTSVKHFTGTSSAFVVA